MSTIQPQGVPYAYGPPAPQYGAPAVPTGTVPYGSPGYANDVYRPTGPYQQGYVQGASASYGASSAIGSAATGMASIFTSLTSVIAKVLNAIVSVVVKIFKGILGIFGIGKKKPKQQQPQQVPLPQQMRPGARMGNIPNPPPGTDIEQARQVVKGDLASVQDPNTAYRHIDLHAKKALDNRTHAEEAAVHAEQLAQEAAVLAQRIEQSHGQMAPQQLNQTLSELELKKTNAMEELKRAEEYTKATYDEALYAHLAMEELLPRFPQVPALSQDAAKATAEGWKAWTTGVEETQYLFMKKRLPPAPEVFTRAVGTVNAQLNQVDQILGRVTIRR